jgi:hypothetical protein
VLKKIGLIDSPLIGMFNVILAIQAAGAAPNLLRKGAT